MLTSMSTIELALVTLAVIGLVVTAVLGVIVCVLALRDAEQRVIKPVMTALLISGLTELVLIAIFLAVNAIAALM